MTTKTKTITGLTAALIILSLALAACSPANPVSAAANQRYGEPAGRGAGSGTTLEDGSTSANGQGRGSSGTARGAGYAQTPLSEAEKDAIVRAVEEEFGALVLYNSIIAQFGSVEPFANIAASEQQHANALLRQAEKYGVAVPQQPEALPPSTYASLADACAAGAAAEVADAALYDELMTLTQRSDLLQVFTRLQTASLENHLPEFEACK